MSSARKTNWVLPTALLGALLAVPFRLPLTEQSSLERVQAEPLVAARRPLARRVLFIMVDGLGADTAYHPGWMHRLEKRLPVAAHGTALASFPTLTPSGIASLMSGRRRPPAVEVPGGGRPGPQRDSVLARLSAVRRRAFVVGQEDWQHLFADHGARLEILPYRGPPFTYDDIQLVRAYSIIEGKQGPWDLLVVHLFDLDGWGHFEGVGGHGYLGALAAVDRGIDVLARVAGPDTVVILTADHGQTKSGSHGGESLAERLVPLVMWGGGIHPGDIGRVEQRDVAPTLSALLGVPAPADCLGWPLLGPLPLDAAGRASVLLDLGEQRRRLWTGARRTWSWLSPRPDVRLAEARRLEADGQYLSAARLAESASRDLAAAVDDAAPRSWFWRTLLGLACLVVAAGTATAWPTTERLFRAEAAAALVYLAALALPILAPAWWPLTSWVSFVSAAALLALGLAGGLGARALGWWAWSAWAAGLATLALPDVVDLRLGLWAIMWCLCAWEASRAGRGRRRALALTLGAVSTAAALFPWTPEPEMSAARAALTFLRWRAPGTPPYGLLAAASFGVLVWAAWKAAGAAARPRWAAVALVAACAPWLDRDDLFFLELGVLAGWGFAELRRAGDPPPLAGLRLGVLCVWAYTLPDDRLDFSHVSVSEAYAAVGRAWHPMAMVWFVVAKHVIVLLTPMLALLEEAPLADIGAALAPLGAVAGGGLLLAWLRIFVTGNRADSLLDDRGFETALWAAFIAWALVAAWGATRIRIRSKAGERAVS